MSAYEMFERFTEQSRQVVVLAQQEARALKHNYIGTEHILLGLLREEETLAAWVLTSRGITVELVHAQLVRIVGAGPEPSPDQIPFTPRAKKVLELALRESLKLGHQDIGPEHILLGLVRENGGVAARILLDFDASYEKVRDDIVRLLPGHRRRASKRGDTGSDGAATRAPEQVTEPFGREPLAFLCHSSHDKRYIRDLDRRLRKDQISTWLDERDLLPGQEWDPAIRRAVRAADVVVVCLSGNSINHSGYVQKEIRHVLDVADEQPDGAVFVIPAIIAPCEVPDRLGRWHWVDLRHRGGYDRLLAGIRGATAPRA